MEKEKIKELDFFRAIAAVLVLLYHYTTRYNISFGHIKTPYYLDVSFGCMGVSIFFILCGFLSIMKINSQKSAKKFLVRRLIRLYPAYLINKAELYIRNILNNKLKIYKIKKEIN